MTIGQTFLWCAKSVLEVLRRSILLQRLFIINHWFIIGLLNDVCLQQYRQIVQLSPVWHWNQGFGSCQEQSRAPFPYFFPLELPILATHFFLCFIVLSLCWLGYLVSPDTRWKNIWSTEIALCPFKIPFGGSLWLDFGQVFSPVQLMNQNMKFN